MINDIFDYFLCIALFQVCFMSFMFFITRGK
jgi:hypothetical protein